jgi:hypothetical protein
MHQTYRYMMLLLYLVFRRYPQLQHLSSNMEQSIQWRRDKVQELKTQHEHVDTNTNTNDNNLPHRGLDDTVQDNTDNDGNTITFRDGTITTNGKVVGHVTPDCGIDSALCRDRNNDGKDDESGINSIDLCRVVPSFTVLFIVAIVVLVILIHGMQVLLGAVYNISTLGQISPP